MTEPIRQGQDLASVDHQLLPIREEEEHDLGPDIPRSNNGLVDMWPGEARIQTGIHSGDVDVTVRLHGAEPDIDPGPWEEVAEVSLRAPVGELMVRPSDTDPPEGLPVLSFQGPGDYRLRVHARGRDTAYDLTPDEVTEWYLIQVWPAPYAAPRMLATADRCGAITRGEIG